MQYYMITIRKHQVKDYVDLHDIHQVMVYLHDHGIDIDEGMSECHGKYKQLHYHGVVKLYKRFYFKPYTKFSGFRIHFKAFSPNALFQIQKYIYKHNPNEEYRRQTLETNYYRNHYGF